MAVARAHAQALAEPFIDFPGHEPGINPREVRVIPVNAGDEVGEIRSRVQAAIERNDAAAHMPLSLVATAADPVIELDYPQRAFRRRFVHPRSRMLVYRDARSPPPAWWQERRIAKVSHQSLPVAGSNARYGEWGALRHCLEPNGRSRRACLERDPAEVWYQACRGEDEREPGRTTARLTWNPHFDHLVAADRGPD